MKFIKKKIGCLGLSADPPHLGHLEIARLLLRKKLVDEIWLIPCYAHSFGKPLSEPRHRWQMAKLLERPGIKVSDVEFSRKGKSYTIDTIKILKEKYPSYQFFWIIGSDIVKSKSYERWKDWDTLKALINFLVVSREGFKIEDLPANFILIEGKISNISSTNIRERVRHGFSIEKLVPQKVKEYIEKHNLYKD